MAERVLISASELAGELSSASPPVVLDVRWNISGPPAVEAYRTSHVPFAVFVDTDLDLAAPPGAGGRHPVPDPATFEAAMRRLGVSQRRPVVVYDAANGASAAARAWWLLRYFGHPHVRLLDGGFAAWRRGAYRVDTDPYLPPPGDFHARPGGLPLLEAGGILRMVERGGALLDARVPERFRGEKEPVDPVAGHIPGARNLPFTEVVDAEGRFLDPGMMRDRFARSGASEHILVGAYCGSGITAAQTVVAGAVAGIDVMLYPGSWSGWITDPAWPVATGEAD